MSILKEQVNHRIQDKIIIEGKNGHSSMVNVYLQTKILRIFEKKCYIMIHELFQGYETEKIFQWSFNLAYSTLYLYDLVGAVGLRALKKIHV